MLELRSSMWCIIQFKISNLSLNWNLRIKIETWLIRQTLISNLRHLVRCKSSECFSCTFIVHVRFPTKNICGSIWGICRRNKQGQQLTTRSRIWCVNGSNFNSNTSFFAVTGNHIYIRDKEDHALGTLCWISSDANYSSWTHLVQTVRIANLQFMVSLSSIAITQLICEDMRRQDAWCMLRPQILSFSLARSFVRSFS